MNLLLLTLLGVTFIFQNDVDLGSLSFNISSPPPYTVAVEDSPHSHRGKTYRIDLGNQIQRQHLYLELLETIRKTGKGDIVIVTLSNYGGSLQTGVRLANALKRTKADVVMHVTGPSYSMGAMLACVGDNLRMDKGTYLMFHDGSVSLQGKINESAKYLKAAQISMKAYLTEHCVSSGILTTKEVDSVMDGTDLYIHETEVADRIKKSKDK